MSEPLEFGVARAHAEAETLLGVKRRLDDSWNYLIDPEAAIAYVHLYNNNRFVRNTPRDLSKVLKYLTAGG